MGTESNNLTRQQLKLTTYLTKILKPMPTLTGSQWANKYFYLSAESSAAAGKVILYPYQEELLDVMTDETTPFVVFKKSTRVGYNKMLNMTVGYFIHQKPSSILFATPNNDEARGTAEDEIEPMIRDNQIIHDLVYAPIARGRTKREKTVKKAYPSGSLELVGAQSEQNFNRRTCRVFLADEIDAWGLEAGKAGDTLTTGLRRTSDFYNRKNILGGKPIIKETSKVVEWYEKGDKRHRYLPCPHCNHYQIWNFQDMVWDKELDEDGNVSAHLTETAHFVCAKCDSKIFDKDKRGMDKKGEWRPHAKYTGIASFYLWAMFSYSPNSTWTHIADEFLIAKSDPLKLKAFHNEVLGQAWEVDSTAIEIKDVDDRLENYEAEVPEPVLVLTCGIDTQDNRLEACVRGWGRYEESYAITYKIFYGDTTKPYVWKSLKEFLATKFMHSSGGAMTISATAVDTAGHSTKAAYQFCNENQLMGVYAIKGAKSVDAPIAPLNPSYKNKGGIALHSVGVNAAKLVIMGYLQTEEEGAGYCHWPTGDQFGKEYFAQLVSEKMDKDGRFYKVRKRNEAIDVFTYNLAALLLARIDLELLYHRGGVFWFPPESANVPKRVKEYHQKSHMDIY